MSLQEKFSGFNFSRNISSRHLFATSFQGAIADIQFFSNDDKLGLQRIITHRERLVYYSTVFQKIFDNKKDLSPIISELQKNIEALNNPESPHIVCLKDGTTSFSIPGGSSGHAISYEFQRDTKGDFYFIIHNRGGGCNDSELHGTLEITDHATGKIYSRTSTKIRCDKELLKDSGFLKNLIFDTQSKHIETAYKHIKKHLLAKKHSSEIIISDQEKRLSELLRSTKNRPSKETQEEILRIIKESSDIHSQQLYGTCAESNLTAAEKNMAPPALIQSEKLYRIKYLIQSIQRKIESDTPLSKLFSGDLKSINEHSIKRIADLEQKIEASFMESSHPIANDLPQKIDFDSL